MENRIKGKTLDSDLRKIKYNAFYLAPILLSFYKECHIKKDNVLLAFLIFPILFNSSWKQQNVNIRKGSKLEKWVLNNKMPLEGVHDRIKYFSVHTTTVLQFCFDQGWALLDDKNNIVLTDKVLFDANPTKLMVNAEKFNCLIENMSVTQIYSTLGISKLCIQE